MAVVVFRTHEICATNLTENQCAPGSFYSYTRHVRVFWCSQISTVLGCRYGPRRRTRSLLLSFPLAQDFGSRVMQPSFITCRFIARVYKRKETSYCGNKRNMLRTRGPGPHRCRVGPARGVYTFNFQLNANSFRLGVALARRSQSI